MDLFLIQITTFNFIHSVVLKSMLRRIILIKIQSQHIYTIQRLGNIEFRL